MEETAASVGAGLLHGFKTRGNIKLKRGKPRVPDHLLLKNYHPRRECSNPRASRWTEEDDRLVREVMIDETRETPSWREISERVLGGRFTPSETRRRWHEVIIIRMGKRGEWTPEETMALLGAVRDQWDVKRQTVISWNGVMLRLATGRIHRHVRQRWLRLRKCAARRLGKREEEITPHMLIEVAGDRAVAESERLIALQNEPEPPDFFGCM